jgi:hypothetical protein
MYLAYANQTGLMIAQYEPKHVAICTLT